MVDAINDTSAVRSIAELTASKADQSKELGKNEFLELMIAQLEHQDPLNPQKGGEFIAQLAQFSSVEGIENLNNTVTTMVNSFQSSQTLQATSMIGRTVQVETNAGVLNSSGVLAGSYDLPLDSQKVNIDIRDSSGQLVRQIYIGPQSKGALAFEWDGKDEDGNAVPVGLYEFDVNAEIGGQSIALTTYMDGNVDSVSMQGNVLALNIGGVGTVAIDQIREIK
ncbi:MAG: flagellar hook assembly protein FlgD [Pseudomonadales bacterium]|nr:flagellar hook assembly protein FlgD [Pseudomonadales bacterium]